MIGSRKTLIVNKTLIGLSSKQVASFLASKETRGSLISSNAIKWRMHLPAIINRPFPSRLSFF